VIDPVLFYSMYIGSASADEAGGIAVDAAGNAYIKGRTIGANLDVAGAGIFLGNNVNNNTSAVFVHKISAAGQGVYITFLGGRGNEEPFGAGDGIAVDAQGNAYVAGSTDSDDFPTTGPGRISGRRGRSPTKKIMRGD